MPGSYERYAKRGTPFGSFKGRHKDQFGTMNRTERAYADRLEELRMAGKVLWWSFEAIKLRLADNTFLTVDFAVMQDDFTLALHEVKAGGPRMATSETKLKVAASLYPFVFIRAEQIAKKLGGGWKVKEWNSVPTEEPQQLFTK